MDLDRRATRGMSLNDKLDYYTYPEPNTGCWLWGGHIKADGYGEITFKKKYYRAHRLSWERHNGPIPSGLLVCHKCDVRSCINPEHLFLGTQKDNIRDALSKGRMAVGEGSPQSKLSANEVIEILNDKRRTGLIALSHNISNGNVLKIKKRESWKHLKMD